MKSKDKKKTFWITKADFTNQVSSFPLIHWVEPPKNRMFEYVEVRLTGKEAKPKVK